MKSKQKAVINSTRQESHALPSATILHRCRSETSTAREAQQHAGRKRWLIILQSRLRKTCSLHFSRCLQKNETRVSKALSGYFHQQLRPVHLGCPLDWQVSRWRQQKTRFTFQNLSFNHLGVLNYFIELVPQTLVEEREKKKLKCSPGQAARWECCAFNFSFTQGSSG